MANIKISQLSAAATLTGTEEVPVVQGGNTVRTTAQDIANLGGGGGGGATTISALGSNITAGEPVIINSDGTVTSVVPTAPVFPAPSLPYSDSTYQGTPNYSAGISIADLHVGRTKTSPHNPNIKITAYIDQGSSNSLNFIITQSDQTGIAFVQPSSVMITNNVYHFDFQFDPFNPNLILVIYNNGSTQGQYLYINHVGSASVPTVATLSTFGFSIYISGNLNYFAFSFSSKYSNLIFIQYSDASSGYMPYLQAVMINQTGPNNYMTSYGSTYSLDTNGYYGAGNYWQILEKMEGSDIFLAYWASYDPGLSANISKVCLFTYSDALWFFKNMPPSLTLGTSYTMVDYTQPNLNTSYALGAHFISSSQIAYEFRYSDGNTRYSMVVGNINASTLTVTSVSASQVYPDTNNNGLLGQTAGFVQMPINKNYFMLVGFAQSGPSTSYVIGNVVKVVGNTVTYSTNDVTLEPLSNSPDFASVSTFSWSSVTFNNSTVGGTANVFFNFAANTGSQLWWKITPVTYINKVFNNQNLLGIAQNTVTTSATVTVLPFGGVDNTQSGLTTGSTYYLQDDGVLTTNVTPTMVGKAVSATKIKTANYPTI
jgi:hypothetical protein